MKFMVQYFANDRFRVFSTIITNWTVVANRSHYFFKKSNFVFSHLTLFPICTLTDYSKNQNNRFMWDVNVDRKHSEALTQTNKM